MATTSAPQNKIVVSKKTLGLVLTAVIAISIFTWLVSSSNQTYNVQIIKFSKETAIDLNNGYVYWPFTVSIQNRGITYVRLLSLLVTILGNDGTEIGRTMEQLTTLGSWEWRTVTVGIYLPYGAEVGKTPLSYVALLKRFDLVLDEATLP